jgi:hypothetical protein
MDMCIHFCVFICVCNINIDILFSDRKNQGRLLEIFYPAGGRGRLQVWDYHQGVPKHTLEFPFAGFSGIDILISHSGAYVALWACGKARWEIWKNDRSFEDRKPEGLPGCQLTWGCDWVNDVNDWMFLNCIYWRIEWLNGWPLGLLRWSSVIFGKSTVTRESTVMALK